MTLGMTLGVYQCLLCLSDPDYDDYFDNEFIQQHCKFHIFSFE